MLPAVWWTFSMDLAVGPQSSTSNTSIHELYVSIGLVQGVFIWIDTCAVLRRDCALFWSEINIFKCTWNKLYLTQTSFLSIHCFPIGLPYRSVILFILAAPSLWEWNLSPAEGRSCCSDHLVVYLNSLLEKHGFGHCESKLWAILVLQAVFLLCFSYHFILNSVCSRLTSNFFDLAVMAEQSNPSAAFLLSLPFLCICYASCCSLTAR